MASHNTESKAKKKKYKKMTLSQKVIAGVAIACAAFMVGAMCYHALMNWKPLIGNEGTVENKLEFSNVDSEFVDDDLDIVLSGENQVIAAYLLFFCCSDNYCGRWYNNM